MATRDLSKFPITTTHWGAYRAEVIDGKLVALHGYEKDRDPSPIAQGMIDTLSDPCRIPQPMVRKGWLERGANSERSGRGREPFVAVSWDRVEGLIADELDRIISGFGNRSIFGGSYGWGSAGRFHHGQSQLYRFLNCLGGFTDRLNTYSFAAGEVVLPYVLGSFYPLLARHTSWPSIIQNTKLVVAFGGLPLKNAQVSMGGGGRHVQRDFMREAGEAGIEFVNIGPVRNDVVEFLNAEWLAPRPSTDVAIMLGVAHTLVDEGLHDQVFLDRYCVGFDKFRSYLLGDDDGVVKNAEWAAGISALEAGAIRSLARRMASRRTMLSLSWSLTRQDHGEQTWWAGLTLAAMLGQIGLPGGGVGFGYSAINAIGNHTGRLPWISLPLGHNPIDQPIPVSRLTDMLMNPGGTYDYNGRTCQYPDTRLVWWANGNPFHHHQDLNRMLEAWRRVETIIVNEPWWNAMARHADIVLPATSPLERDDLGSSAQDGHMFAARQAVQPFAQARHDFQIFASLSSRLGFEERFTEGRDEQEWMRHLYDVARQQAASLGTEMPSYDEFRERGVLVAEVPDEPNVMFAAFRDDPDANPLRTASGKIEIFCDTIAAFGYHDCLGHPAWFEPLEWLGSDRARKFPLHLNSNQPPRRLHSQLDNGSFSRGHKVSGREPITMHPDDAAARGIDNGDVVRVFNDRGACLAGAVISEAVRSRTVQLPTGAWYDPEVPGEIGSLCKHGNPNVLTPDKGTSSLAQGPIAHSCLVEVEKFPGEPPPVTAFDPPAII